MSSRSPRKWQTTWIKQRRNTRSRRQRFLAVEHLEGRHLLAAIYVDGDNLSSGDGSQQNPFQTIQQGINAAAANPGDDEVLVDPIASQPNGAYRWVFMNDASGAVSLRGTGASPSNVRIDPLGEDWAIRVTLRNNVTISNLTVVNAWSAGIQADGLGDLTLVDVVSTGHRLQAKGLLTRSTGNITIVRGAYVNNPTNGIYIVNAQNVHFDSVTVTGNGTAVVNNQPGSFDGVYLDTAQTVFVDRSDFSSNTRDGLNVLNIAAGFETVDARAVGNAISGLRVSNSAVPVVITRGTFDLNGVHGIKLINNHGSDILVAEIRDNGGSSFKTDGTSANNWSGGTGIHISTPYLEPIRIATTSVLRNKQYHVGAGIYINAPGYALLTSVTVENNINEIGQSMGGGIYFANQAGTLEVLGSSISNNRSNVGGGIFSAGTLKVDSSTIAGNNANDTGGAIYQSMRTATVSQSTLSGNSSGFAGGGAIRLFSAGATIVNSTISGNTTTGNGGGIRMDGSGAGLVQVKSSTIAGNRANAATAGRFGGGIRIESGNLQLLNTVVATNFAATGPDISGSVSTQGYNLIGNMSGSAGFAVGASDLLGTGANPIDPKLAPLAINGGATKTHALLQGSPAIDRGPSSSVGGLPGFDQRGVLRPQGLAFDVGAFENVNNAPIAGDDSATTPEDAAVEIVVLLNDSDPDGDSLSITATTSPASGNVVVNANGTVTFTPLANFNGAVSFDYTVSDGRGFSDIGTVHVTVTSVEDVPIASDDAATTNEETAITIVVLGNDSDTDGDPIRVESVGGAQNGTVMWNADDTITYLPWENFTGLDSFIYSITDGKGNSDGAVVMVNVQPVNDLPDATNDAATTNEDTAVVISPLSNDLDADGDTLSISSATTPLHGTVTIHANGTMTYAPVANYYGPDEFNYSISDGKGGADTASVQVMVHAVQDAPQANDDAAVTAEDNSISIAVLSNDLDVDGDSLSVSVVGNASHGTATLNSNSITYTPNPNYFGADSFTYAISDGKGGTSSAVVNVVITPVNDAPDAVNDSATTNEDYAVTINVLNNDSDLDGNTLVISSASDPAKGSTAVNANGTITYTPDLNASGPDTFVYTISDGQGGSDTASVTMQIVKNLAPVITSAISSNGDFDTPSNNGDVRIDGSFTDPDASLDTHIVTVDWGDGTAAGPVNVNQLNDTFSGLHHYASAGSYAASVTVRDNQGNSSTTSTVAAVVTGISLRNGVLYVIGTTQNDTISITTQGNSKLKVGANFISSGSVTFDSSNISRIVAHLGSGNDSVSVASQVAISAILDGGAGDDVINGGDAPSLLIGGRGSDQLTGGNKGDVLIGGIANNTDAALLSILADWKSNATYESRVNLLRSKLVILDDAVKDTLIGGKGRDLFFRSALDSLTDVSTKKEPETVVSV